MLMALLVFHVRKLKLKNKNWENVFDSHMEKWSWTYDSAIL